MLICNLANHTKLEFRFYAYWLRFRATVDPRPIGQQRAHHSKRAVRRRWIRPTGKCSAISDPISNLIQWATQQRSPVLTFGIAKKKFRCFFFLFNFVISSILRCDQLAWQFQVNLFFLLWRFFFFTSYSSMPIVGDVIICDYDYYVTLVLRWMPWIWPVRFRMATLLNSFLWPIFLSVSFGREKKAFIPFHLFWFSLFFSFGLFLIVVEETVYLHAPAFE